VLRAENLTKRFGGVQAVRDVALEVAPGTVHSIIGPNGAGKTTLLNLLSGITRADSGRIYLETRELTACEAHQVAAAGIGRTFQNLQIFFNMTAAENVIAGGWLHQACSFLSALLRTPGRIRAEREARAEAQALLEFVGLARWAGAAADSLPYGALKRLEIARALAGRPKVLLLDEPAAGLNPAETREIDELIRRIAQRGVTVLLVEHNMKLVMEVSQRVLVLHEGRKLAEGEPRAVRENPRVIEAYLGVDAC
jgi:branched-chain amino acid transport system ATP-binding protein